MNHQAIIDQLTTLAPQLKSASNPEEVLVKYASERNLSPAQLERIGQVYNIAKTLNFMDKSANRGDSFKVLDTTKMLSDFTSYKPKIAEKVAGDDWSMWFNDTTSVKAASETEKEAKIVEEDGQYVIYNEAGTKKLSKPFPDKGAAVKRLQQIEYFKRQKQAGLVPNINALAKDIDFSDGDVVGVYAEPLPAASSMEEIKDELSKESFVRFELQATDQVIDDSTDELYKLANELLQMHRMSPIPFATMEADAFYSSNTPASIKVAADAIANYFDQKGWKLDRHDFNSAPPKLARDRHNVLPLFKSASDKIEIIKAAKKYREDFEKKAMSRAERDAQKKSPPLSSEGNVNLPGGRSRGTRAEREGRSQTTSTWEALSEDGGGGAGKKKNKEDGSEKDKGWDKPISTTKDLISGATKLYDPSHYMNSSTQEYISNIMRAPTVSNKNDRQKTVDTAADDVGRVTNLQRLMLSDPIIGEADPDTVVGLYNTLARANPEVVQDANLLRLALREAIQYEAVPLHTYKDLITMRKEKGQASESERSGEEARYRI